MKTVRLFIKGRVQGVFFRQRTQEIARELGLTGSVKNLPDGRVEVVAQGSDDNLNKLVEFCRKGPRTAKVEEVKIMFEEAKTEFSSFDIAY